MTTEAAEIERAARELREFAVALICGAADHNVTFGLLNAVWITDDEVLAAFAELTALRRRGATDPAYAAWNKDFCALLRRLSDEARRTDAEAEQKSRAVTDALNALGYGTN
jgi:hypothetical protein